MFDLNLGRVGLSPRPDYRPGQQAAPLDLVSFGGSLWVCTAPTTDAPAEDHAAWMPAAKGGLMRLTSDLTLYVREDGDDSSSGLEDSPQGAFKTPQAALNHVARTYHLDAYALTIKIGPGTFPQFVCYPYQTLSGGLVVEGSGNSTVIQAVNRNAVQVDGYVHSFALRDLAVHVRLTVASSSTRTGILSPYNRQVEVSGVHIRMDEEVPANAYIYGVSCRGGSLNLRDGVSFEMNAPGGGSTSRMCALQAHEGGTLSIYDDIAVSGAVYASVRVQTAGCITRHGGIFTGSFTSGMRYRVITNGMCITNGGGEEFFPGSTAGTVATGGQYFP